MKTKCKGFTFLPDQVWRDYIEKDPLSYDGGLKFGTGGEGGDVKE